MTMTTATYDVDAVADAIGWPAEEWAGSCFAVAGEMIDRGLVEGGVRRYGLYLGPVAPGGLFNPDRPAQRHGWVEDGEGRVVDPTRWAFECVDPYIFVGDYGADYDAGGNTLLPGARAGYPTPGRAADDFVIDLDPGTFVAVRKVVWACGGLLAGPDRVRLSPTQACWLACCPPQWFGLPAAKVLYAALAGDRALIPRDHWRDVMVSGSLAPLHPSVPRLGVLGPGVPNPLDCLRRSDDDDDAGD